jgi:predicted nucleotidyltransferase
MSALHDIVDSVTKRSGLSRDDFGIFGSMLHGFYHPRFSDVDLAVYGTRSLQTLREMLGEVYEEDRSSLANEFESDQVIAGKRWLFRSISVKEFVWHQRRKLIYALFNDTRSGRMIKTEFEPVRAWEEIREQNSIEKVESCGWVRMIARVIDDSQAPFMPSIYGIQPLNVLIGPTSALDADCIVSFLEEFRLQVFKDEIAYVEGNLEHVENQNRSHYQITLTFCPRYYEQTLKTVSSDRL